MTLAMEIVCTMSNKLVIRVWPELMITCASFPGVSGREKMDNHKELNSKKNKVYSWKVIAVSIKFHNSRK